MSTYEKLKTIENFKLLDLKVVMAAYERWSLMLARRSKYSDYWETFGIFENWSVTRRDCIRRFDSK